MFICRGLGLHGPTGKAGQDMSSQPSATASVRSSGVSHRTLMTWRLLSVIMLLVMGGIHLYLVFYGVGGLLGALFVLNAVGALVLAIAVIVLRGRLLSLATVLSLLFMVGTLLALVLALTVGLFGIHEVLKLQAGAHHAGGGIHRHDHPGGNRRAGVAVATSTLTAHLPANLTPCACGSDDRTARPASGAPGPITDAPPTNAAASAFLLRRGETASSHGLLA